MTLIQVTYRRGFCFTRNIIYLSSIHFWPFSSLIYWIKFPFKFGPFLKFMNAHPLFLNFPFKPLQSLFTEKKITVSCSLASCSHDTVYLEVGKRMLWNSLGESALSTFRPWALGEINSTPCSRGRSRLALATGHIIFPGYTAGFRDRYVTQVKLVEDNETHWDGGRQSSLLDWTWRHISYHAQRNTLDYKLKMERTRVESGQQPNPDNEIQSCPWPSVNLFLPLDSWLKFLSFANERFPTNTRHIWWGGKVCNISSWQQFSKTKQKKNTHHFKVKETDLQRDNTAYSWGYITATSQSDSSNLGLLNSCFAIVFTFLQTELQMENFQCVCSSLSHLASSSPKY